MAATDISALLALGAAFFIAVGNVVHQRSAHDVTDEPVGLLDLFLRLLRDRQWWLGSAVAALGSSLQIVGLPTPPEGTHVARVDVVIRLRRNA